MQVKTASEPDKDAVFVSMTHLRNFHAFVS